MYMHINICTYLYPQIYIFYYRHTDFRTEPCNHNASMSSKTNFFLKITSKKMSSTSQNLITTTRFKDEVSKSQENAPKQSSLVQHTHTHTYTHTHAHTYTHTHTHTNKQTHTCPHAHTSTHSHEHKYMVLFKMISRQKLKIIPHGTSLRQSQYHVYIYIDKYRYTYMYI